MDKNNGNELSLEQPEVQRTWLGVLGASARSQVADAARDRTLPPRDFSAGLTALQPHDHLCLIHDSPEEWQRAIVPFLKTGLQHGEQCIYVADASRGDEIISYVWLDQVRSYLWQDGIDVTAAEKSGQLAILRGSETGARGTLDPGAVIALLIDEAERAIARGYPLQRVAIEMSLVLQGGQASENLARYEAKVHQDLVARHACLVMCGYDRSRFDIEAITAAVMAHPMLAFGDDLYHNSHYVPPERLLEHRLGERGVQGWLIGLERERVHREHTRTEEIIRQGQLALSTLVNNLPGMAYRCAHNDEPTMEFVSQGCFDLTGYQPSDLEQNGANPYGQLVHPEDRDRVSRDLQIALQEGGSFQIEYRIATADRAEKWVLDRGRAVAAEEGKSFTAGFVTDITGRKQTELKLLKTTSALHAIFRALPDAYVRLNSAGVILDYTGGGTTTLFALQQAVLHKRLQDVLPEPLGLQLQDALLQVLRTHAALSVAYSLGVADGERFFEAKLLPLLETQVILIARDITEHKRAEERVRQTLDQVRKTLDGAVRALAAVIERRDPYTAGHQQRACQLAAAIARQMGLPEDLIECVRVAAALHDIGKICVPVEILNKPGQVSDVEFSIIRSHPQVGFDILKAIAFPWPVAQIVLQHHERMNGTGYPAALCGDDILLEARILGVADVVEGMSSRRPHRERHSTDEILNELSQNRGLLYDPAVVDACRTVLAHTAPWTNATSPPHAIARSAADKPLLAGRSGRPT